MLRRGGPDSRLRTHRSLTESIDTTTPGGRLVFHVFGALAEFERDLIRERTQAGLTAARARGRTGGRPPSLTPKQRELLQQLYADKTHSIADITRTLRISKATLYRHLNAEPAHQAGARRRHK